MGDNELQWRSQPFQIACNGPFIIPPEPLPKQQNEKRYKIVPHLVFIVSRCSCVLSSNCQNSDVALALIQWIQTRAIVTPKEVARLLLTSIMVMTEREGALMVVAVMTASVEEGGAGPAPITTVETGGEVEVAVGIASTETAETATTVAASEIAVEEDVSQCPR